MDEVTIQNIMILLAVQKKNHTEIKRLLSDKVDPNCSIQAKNGTKTPLLIAVALSDHESVRMLLEYGADIDLKIDREETPFELAMQSGNVNIIAQFKNYKKKLEAKEMSTTSKQAQEACFYTYKRRQGTSAIAGQLYESKLLALILLRLKELNTPFHLGSNVDGIGHFDDIVVRYFCPTTKQHKLIFVQAKHREDSEKNKINLNAILDSEEIAGRGAFSIHKNFENYLKILIKFYKQEKKSFFEEDINTFNIEVVLLTNANFGFNPSKQAKQSPLIKTSETGCAFQISQEKPVLDNLCKQVDEEFISKIMQHEEKKKDCKVLKLKLAVNFLQRFKIYYNQPNEADMGKIIEKSISRSLNSSNPQILSLIYHQLVQEYWMKKNHANFLTENNDLLEDARRMMASETVVLGKLTDIYLEKTKGFDLVYTDNSVKSLGLDQPVKGVVNVFSRSPVLSLFKISKYLKKIKYTTLAIIDTENIVVDCCEIIAMFLKQSVFKQLILCSTNLNECEHFASLIPKIKNDDLSIIIVSDEAFSNFMTDLVPGLHKISDKWINFVDTTPKTQRNILETKTITFQGKRIKLNKLLRNLNDHDHILKKYITGTILMQFVNEGSCEIARLSDHQVEFYVDRKFQRLNRLNNITKEFIVVENVENISKNKTKETKDLVVISNTKQKFNLIKSRFPTRNVHWLKEHMGDYLWQCSSNSLNKMRKFLKYDHDQFPVQISKTFSDRVMIIAAEPGMGKSTILTELMHKVNASDFVWKVRLNLRDFVLKFEAMQHKTVNLRVALDFLIESLKIPYDNLEIRKMKISLKSNQHLVYDDFKQLEGKIFEACYNQGKVILLVDGFDEIAPNYNTTVLNLLKEFRDSKIRQMVITTRVNRVKYQLENHFNIFACTLVPFTKQDIIEFLEKFWRYQLSNITWNVDRFKSFTEELFTHYSYNAESKFEIEDNFLGIPLHIQMIASFLQKKFEQCNASDNDSSIFKFKTELSLCSLYKNFIETKLNKIYFMEKNAMESSAIIISDIDFRKSFKKMHKRLALCAIFDDDVVETLLSQEAHTQLLRDFEKVESGKEKTGFINQIIDGKPEFIHLTFAEYFASEFLWDSIKSSSDDKFKWITDTILIGYLLRNDKQQICQFTKEMALDDPVDFENKFKKGCYLLSILNQKKSHSRCKSLDLLLGIVESCMPKHNPEIDSFNLENHWSFVLKSARLGYYNLLRIFMANSYHDIDKVRIIMGKICWASNPLLLAADKEAFDIVKMLNKKFFVDVSWLDKCGDSLFDHLLKNQQYTLILTLLKLGIFELGKPYGNNKNHPLCFALETKGTPQGLVEMLLKKTNVAFFNKMGFSVQDWCLLNFEQSFIDSVLKKKINIQQSVMKSIFANDSLNPTWKITYDDFRGNTRACTDVFSHTWIDQICLLIKNGAGIHHKTFKLIKKINLVLKVLTLEHQNLSNLSDHCLKAIIIDHERKNALKLKAFKKNNENRFYFSWIDVTNKIDENERTNITVATESLNILNLLNLNALPEISANLQRLISEIVECRAAKMLFDAIDCFDDQQLPQIAERKELSKKISDLKISLGKFRKIWIKLIVSIKKHLSDSDFVKILEKTNKNKHKIIANLVGEKYGTLLHYAVFKNNLSVIKILLKRDANPNIRTDHFKPQKFKFSGIVNKIIIKGGITPMFIAVAQGNLEVVKLLHENGASLNHTTSKIVKNSRFTPLDVALSEGHSDIVQYLQENGALSSESD